MPNQVEEYIAVMEKVRLRDGIKLAMAISAEGNKFLQDQQPWAVLKKDRDECAGLVTASECKNSILKKNKKKRPRSAIVGSCPNAL